MRRIFSLIVFCQVLLICSRNTAGAELLEISVVTDRVVVLHIGDGDIRYHGPGQAPWHHDEVVQDPLNVSLASDTAAYSICSPDDPEYAGARHPLRVGRKSKLGDATPRYQNTVVLEHWIYLMLPSPLVPGNSYTVGTGELLEEPDTVAFSFDPLVQVSPAVHVNMVGYSTRSRLKFGYIHHWMGDLGPLDLGSHEGNGFFLVTAGGSDTVFSSNMVLRKDLETGAPDTENGADSYNFNMADVYECDFSEFSDPGEYRLVVDGIGCSHTFLISDDAYREAFVTAARGLYHQRSGPERSLPWSPWYKGADHMPGRDGFSITYSRWRFMDGSNAFTELPANATEAVFPVRPGVWMPEDPLQWGWGGYFDAGDFDRHHKHLAVSEYLMLAYELAPQNFTDGELAIPGSGNGVPDVLDEARWSVDCYRRLNGPTGGICGGMESDGHPNPGQNSVTDSRPWFVYAEEPQASYHLSAAAAQLAYCLVRAGFIGEMDSLITQAEKVYRWAGLNMQPGDESKVSPYRMRAAAWLYRATGKKEYHQQFLADHSRGVQDDFASYAYILTDLPGVRPDIRHAHRQRIALRASGLLEAGKIRSDRWANMDLNEYHRVGSGSTPYIFPLVFAHLISGNREYLDFAYTTCDYFLGGNPLNMVYMTGLGENPVRAILHLDSWFDNREEVIPGVVPYAQHTYGSWMESGSGNVYQPLGNFESCYPGWREWPVHELWFENRYLIIQNEFTVHQTMGPAAAAYGYLCDTAHKTGVPVERVTIDRDTLRMYAGESFRVHAAVSPYDAVPRSVEWSSAEEKTVTVSNGYLTALSEGETQVVALSGDGLKSDTLVVFVEKYVEATGIEVLEDSLKMQVGDTARLHAEVIPEDASDPDHTWSVDEPGIASVSSDGMVTALDSGTATVYAVTLEGAFKDGCTIHVSPESSTGVAAAQPALDYVVRIIPNPVDGDRFRLVLRDPDLKDPGCNPVFRIYDLAGRPLLAQTLAGGEGVHIIDTGSAGIAPGGYMWRLEAGKTHPAMTGLILFN